MDIDLLGYLLGALDAPAEQRVKALLERSPEARARLAELADLLAPLGEDAEGPEPPSGLVEATLARVADLASGGLPTAPRSSTPPLPVRRWFRAVDWAVAAAAALVVGVLGGPLLVQQVQASRRTACADNLRRFWQDLEVYSDQRAGTFPCVEADGPRAVAGAFAPLLRDAGLLRQARVACPARSGGMRVTPSMADLEHLYRSAPGDYERASRELAGHYAYSLGYHEGGRLRGLCRDSGDHLPIMADQSEGAGCNSPNHGGGGQNVLFVGGVVRWCTRATVGEGGDDIYVNRHNLVRAGLGRADSVLAGGGARPLPLAE